MKMLKIFSLLCLGLLINLWSPVQNAYGQDACTRTEYYDGCGNLYWSTGGQNCSNVIVVYMDFECDT